MRQIKGKKIAMNDEKVDIEILDDTRKKQKKKNSSKLQTEKSIYKRFRKRKIHFCYDNFENDLDKYKFKVRGAKIRDYSLFLEEVDYELENGLVLNDEIEIEENLSIGIIVFILFVCFVLGICVGYLLYRVAINNSAIVMVSSLLG